MAYGFRYVFSLTSPSPLVFVLQAGFKVAHKMEKSGSTHFYGLRRVRHLVYRMYAMQAVKKWEKMSKMGQIHYTRPIVKFGHVRKVGKT